MLVSFVIPCYHSEKTIEGVVNEIDAAMKELPQYTHEIIMVNDGVPNECWNEIRRICQAVPENAPDGKRLGICLARNFGQHAALMAGRLLSAIEAGADVVYAKYSHKQHSGFRNWGSRVNERMLTEMLGKPKDLYVSSYFAMRRYVAREVLKYENSYPYLIGLVLRTTTNIVNVPIDHRARRVGRSGYTLGRLFALWMNGFTAFSIKPLRIATFIGTISAIAGFIYGIYTIIKKFINPGVPVGFSALMSAIVFFGGMTILMIGMAGEYIGRTYISVNRAPQYVIRETTRLGVDDNICDPRTSCGDGQCGDSAGAEAENRSGKSEGTGEKV